LKPARLCLVALLLPASLAAAQPSHGEWRRLRAQHEQEMMTDLHTVLRIRPDEEGAFQQFAASMHPPDRAPPDMEDLQHLTTPELIDRENAREAAHDADERRREAAVKRFYAALSPEQRQVFDALHRLTMGHGGWRMHGRHGPPPPP
jgi:periplasmic protein CpxP/Spy